MRIRAPLLLCLLLAACTVAWDERHLEATIVRPSNFKAGSGVIQSVGVLRGQREAGTGVDADGKHPDRNLYRLLIHMDAGGVQTWTSIPAGSWPAKRWSSRTTAAWCALRARR